MLVCVVVSAMPVSVSVSVSVSWMVWCGCCRRCCLSVVFWWIVVDALSALP